MSKTPTGIVATYNADVAQIYDRFLGGMARRLGPLIPALHRRLRPDAPATFLDACAGTGLVSKAFLDDGYIGVALDISPDMLTMARERLHAAILADRAQLVCADVCDFRLKAPVALASCINASVNHLPSNLHLEAAFGAIRSALHADGIFVFDVNTRKGLRRMNGQTLRDQPDGYVNVSFTLLPDGTSAAFQAVGFYPAGDGRWCRFEERNIQVAFDLEWMKDHLLKHGWSRVSFLAIDLETTVTAPEDHDTVVVVAER